MNKIILSVIAVIVIVLFAANTSFVKRYYKIYFGTDEMFISADTDDFDRGPQVGTAIPTIRGLFNGQEITNLNDLAGANGTVFVVNRSLEWCPFCMRQSIELQNMKQAFDDEGIAIVMMTYDSPDLQQAFIDRHSIEFPVLSDVNAESFANLGVLREEYGPEDNNYGLPYPGMIVVDTEGVIKGKLFIESYSYRVDTAAVLTFAMQHLLK